MEGCPICGGGILDEHMSPEPIVLEDGTRVAQNLRLRFAIQAARALHCPFQTLNMSGQLGGRQALEQNNLCSDLGTDGGRRCAHHLFALRTV